MRSRYKVREYLLEDGRSPYEEWFMGLDVIAAAKITTVKLKLEQGNLSNVRWFDGIGEYRLDLGAWIPGLYRQGWRQADSPPVWWHEKTAVERYRKGDRVLAGV